MRGDRARNCALFSRAMRLRFDFLGVATAVSLESLPSFASSSGPKDIRNDERFFDLPIVGRFTTTRSVSTECLLRSENATEGSRCDEVGTNLLASALHFASCLRLRQTLRRHMSRSCVRRAWILIFSSFSSDSRKIFRRQRFCHMRMCGVEVQATPRSHVSSPHGPQCC